MKKDGSHMLYNIWHKINSYCPCIIIFQKKTKNKKRRGKKRTGKKKCNKYRIKMKQVFPILLYDYKKKEKNVKKS